MTVLLSTRKESRLKIEHKFPVFYWGGRMEISFGKMAHPLKRDSIT
jgi:hypothetical protein